MPFLRKKVRRPTIENIIDSPRTHIEIQVLRPDRHRGPLVIHLGESVPI